MSIKTIGIALIVVGVLVIAVSLLADVIGLGSGGGIGLKQWAGAAVGLVVAVGGIVLALRQPKS